MADLLNDVRAYLISLDIVRDNRVAGTEPPAWIEPRNGTPAPGEGKNATEVGSDVVVGIFIPTGIPMPPFQSSLTAEIVEFRIRARKAPIGRALAKAIRAALADKRDWWIGTQRVIASEEWRPLDLIASDDQAFDFLISFVFWTYT